MVLGSQATPEPVQQAVKRVDPPAGPGAMAPNLGLSGPDELLLTWLEPQEPLEGVPWPHG